MLFLLIFLFGALASFLGPWWLVIPVCIVACFFRAKSAKQAFGVSASAIVSLWTLYALVKIFTSQVDLVQPMAKLLLSSTEAPSNFVANGLIFSVITLIATLIGGFGGLTGYQTQKLKG